MTPGDTSPILFFDGECNLCNGLVQFVLKRDKKKIFFFSSLQSGAGKDATAAVVNSGSKKIDSVILYYKGTYYTHSSAALRIFRLLGGLWPVLFAGIILPSFFRDGAYNFVSRHRYKWFGKCDTCMIPTPDIMARFHD